MKTIIKVAKVVGAVAGIITSTGIILAFLIYLFFNATDSGKEIMTAIDFTIDAEAEHNEVEMRLDALEEEVDEMTMARELEWNYATDSWQLRTFEDEYKRIYPAYISQSQNRRGSWVYIKNGYEYLVYP